VELLPL